MCHAQKQSLGRISKFGSNNLKKLTPPLDMHRTTDRQTDRQTSRQADRQSKMLMHALLSPLQGNLLNMQMSPPVFSVCHQLSILFYFILFYFILPPTPFLCSLMPQPTGQSMVVKAPTAVVFGSELWVRMFTQVPHGIIYLEGCLLEKC